MFPRRTPPAAALPPAALPPAALLAHAGHAEGGLDAHGAWWTNEHRDEAAA